MASQPDISVVIPVHNEEKCISALVLETCRILRGQLAFEIIVVDDASDDDTCDLLQQCMEAIPELRPLRHGKQAGQSRAIMTGVQAARAEIIVTMDGDGQNDPADILTFWTAMQGAWDGTFLLLAGQRVRRQDTFIKKASSKVANIIRSSVLRDATPDTGCGMKMFSRQLFLQLPFFDHMHRFLPALVIRMGGRVVSLPVNHRPRRGGRSHYGTLDRLVVGLIDLFGVYWLRLRWTDSGGATLLSIKNNN
ncbi:glycosyltransferase family 2 protein [uncultured Ferrovibrio sp.]|jgi:Glycosyltransferases involved in cell wall biogenesis|uniref:glycosyltransferase family 2 protein n=1 Tax=uncultured Ferrovibrio sp. TaxID=1576913 RepID=UPI00262703C4|nr:glycosyltransferase family 2 protein [uncultured Ferrovibrio sp.]